MRPNSLAFRLFVAAAVWSLVVLPLTAFVLLSVYRGTVERSFDARLNVYLTSLVADAAVRTDLAANPPQLRDPVFKLPFSGWYYQITPLGTSDIPIATSESLLDQRFPQTTKNAQRASEYNIHRFYAQGPENQRLRVLEREITLEKATPPDNRFLISVAGDSEEIENSVREFRTLLVIALSILGAGLVLATFFQVRFGLRPLRAIGAGLADIRSGKAELLESDLPAEIEPLQTELNALINSNRAIVERARTHVGNLAHALKTPLSVITNEAGQGRSSLADKVREQARMMRDQIDHHLNRASIAARSGVVSAHTPVKPVLEALARTLGKIYSDRQIRVELDCAKDLIFQGEKQDLEEMAGNLMDNACKWAKSRVSVQATPVGSKLEIVVEDDGPGLSVEDRQAALKRGRRLDESKPGSGLGLSIVAELVHLYQGTFELENGGKGGLRAVLRFERS